MPAKGINYENPIYAGGDQDSLYGKPRQLTDYYAKRQTQSPYNWRGNEDPYFKDWSAQGQANQLADRQSLMDAYADLEKQAAGGATPQQLQMMKGYEQAAQNQQNMAAGARGGAYGRSAANASLTQNAGIQGAQNVQNLNVQRAQDQMNAIGQMQGLSAALRAGDLQAQGMTAEDAQRRAGLDVEGRGLNFQRQLGYAGLEDQARRSNWDSLLAAYRRTQMIGDIEAKKNQAEQAGYMQAASSFMGGVASDKRAKQEAFLDGVQVGEMSPALKRAKNKEMLARLGSVGPVSVASGESPAFTPGERANLNSQRNLQNADLFSYAFPSVERTSSPMTPDQARLSAEADQQKAQLMAAFAAPSPIGQHGVSPLSAQAQREASGLMGALSAPSPIVDSVEQGPSAYPPVVDWSAALARSDQGNALVSDERAKEQAYLRGKLDGTRETTINMQAERDAGAGRGSKAAGELGVQKYAEGNIGGALQDFKNAPPGKVRDAQIRIAESKVSPNATSPSDARIAADRTLDKLSQSQSLYSYTHPSVDTNPTSPGQPHLGVMAQDLEDAPVGEALVQMDPITGLRTINAPAGLSAAFAGLGRLNERTRALESRRR